MQESRLKVDLNETGLWKGFKEKYSSKSWYKEISTYLRMRYPPIIDRFLNTFRYVDFDPKNADSCSYEFASLLRDIGSIFNSVLDTIVEQEGRAPKYGPRYNILDYRDFLLENFPTIDEISVVLNVNYDQKYILPYEGFKKSEVNSVWWNAYNAVKHQDIKCREFGCLSNVIYGVCALTIIYEQFIIPRHVIEMRNRAGGVIEEIWFYDLSAIRNMIFPLPKYAT